MTTTRWAAFGLAVCFGLFAARPVPARDDKVAGKPAEKPAAFEVERHKDIAYRTDPDADKTRHKLDVYVPKGQKDFPVVLFVHGGTWRSGSKNLYAGLG